MSESLTDFFRQKRSQATAAGIDWTQRKDEWLAALNDLYAMIRSMLSKPLSEGLAKITMQRKQIVEEHIGSYDVDELILSVGDEQVVFSPKGRNIVGAAGRVDVRGEVGEAMLVVQPGPRWSLVAAKYPTLKTVPLDDETLGEALRAVMRQ